VSWGIGGTLWDELHTGPNNNTWAWNTGGVGIDAPSGTFTLNVWMRESGQKLDQVLLTDSYTPPATLAQHGVSYVWVRVPHIAAASSDNTIWMYFDNPAAAAGQAPSAVWDSSYAAVWHVQEDPTGAAPQYADSTGYANHATVRGAIPADSRLASQVGPGLNLDGDDDHLEICVDNCSPSLRIAGNAFTLEAWTHIDETGEGADDGLIGKHNSGSDERYFLGVDAPYWITCRATTTNGHFSLVRGGMKTMAWTYLVCRYDGGLANSQLQGWVNGSRVGSTSASGTLLDSGTDDVLLGKRVDSRHFEGWVDELRISNVARSDSYISAQHRSMRDQIITFDVAELR
jgi:biopolymer transport protein ExbB